MSLPVATRVKMRTATVIAASASLPPVTLTTTLRAAAGEAEAPAAVHLVAQAVPVVPTVGMVICHGTKSGKL